MAAQQPCYYYSRVAKKPSRLRQRKGPLRRVSCVSAAPHTPIIQHTPFNPRRCNFFICNAQPSVYENPSLPHVSVSPHTLQKASLQLLHRPCAHLICVLLHTCLSSRLPCLCTHFTSLRFRSPTHISQTAPPQFLHPTCHTPMFQHFPHAFQKAMFQFLHPQFVQGRGRFREGRILRGNFAVKKSGEIFPLANFSRRATNIFTANSDAGEY